MQLLDWNLNLQTYTQPYVCVFSLLFFELHWVKSSWPLTLGSKLSPYYQCWLLICDRCNYPLKRNDAQKHSSLRRANNFWSGQISAEDMDIYGLWVCDCVNSLFLEEKKGSYRNPASSRIHNRIQSVTLSTYLSSAAKFNRTEAKRLKTTYISNFLYFPFNLGKNLISLLLLGAVVVILLHWMEVSLFITFFSLRIFILIQIKKLYIMFFVLSIIENVSSLK